MEGRRRERRLQRLPAQGQTLGAVCNKAREVFSGTASRWLRYPWAQSPPKTEELGQRRLDTCLEDGTQAPSKKDPRQNCPPLSPSSLR